MALLHQTSEAFFLLSSEGKNKGDTSGFLKKENPINFMPIAKSVDIIKAVECRAHCEVDCIEEASFGVGKEIKCLRIGQYSSAHAFLMARYDLPAVGELQVMQIGPSPVDTFLL